MVTFQNHTLSPKTGVEAIITNVAKIIVHHEWHHIPQQRRHTCPIRSRKVFQWLQSDAVTIFNLKYFTKEVHTHHNWLKLKWFWRKPITTIILSWLRIIKTTRFYGLVIEAGNGTDSGPRNSYTVLPKSSNVTPHLAFKVLNFCL